MEGVVSIMQGGLFALVADSLIPWVETVQKIQFNSTSFEESLHFSSDF